MKCIPIIIVILFLVSCEEPSSSARVQEDSTSVSNPVIDTQTYYFQQTAKLMGLTAPTLSDSFVLRLWIRGIIIPHRMIELRKSGNEWHSEKYDYNFEQDGRLLFKSIPLKNKGRSRLLLDTLRTISFSNFVSQEDIPGFQDKVADGMTYHLEVFQFGRYIKLTYHCPETYYSIEANNKRFVDLLMLLDRQFDFYSPICKQG